MQIDIEHIDEIRERFAKMQSREDLLELLNIAKQLIYGDEAHPIRLKALAYYCNPDIAKNRYREFAISKKSGGPRKIHAPVQGLKTIQKCLNLVLQCIFEPHTAATGFVTGRSIVDNAMVHKGMHYVYNIDLKDFFPSIGFKRVKVCLGLPPFALNDEIQDGRGLLAFFIAHLCCASMEVERKDKSGSWIKEVRFVLPQGAPTSPTITNVVSQRLDRKLTGVAKRFGANYSRYADDITFSSSHNIYQPGSEFIVELNRIVAGQRFDINPLKTRLQKSCYRQEVTGLVVNEKPNVHRRYVKKIRTMLHNWEKLGFHEANKIFLSEYAEDKGHVNKGVPDFVNVLAGKLEFLRMVKGSDDSTYKKMNQRFNDLIQKEKLSRIQEIDFNEIIEVMMKDGLGKAMDLFDKYNPGEHGN